jgi:hypothetical protein
MLCSLCESRLQSGQIREADVQASKSLLQVAGHVRGEATLVRSFRVDGNYVLEFDQPGLAVFRNNPEIVAELERSLGERVWLARASSSNREFIEDLLSPVKVLSLGTVWLPDGTKLAKAVVPGRAGRRIHSLELIRRIAREVRGIDLVVESDDKNQLLEMAAGRGSSHHSGAHPGTPAADHPVYVDAQPLEVADGRVSPSASSEHSNSGPAQQGHQIAHTNQGGR